MKSDLVCNYLNNSPSCFHEYGWSLINSKTQCQPTDLKHAISMETTIADYFGLTIASIVTIFEI